MTGPGCDLSAEITADLKLLETINVLYTHNFCSKICKT